VTHYAVVPVDRAVQRNTDEYLPRALLSTADDICGGPLRSLSPLCGNSF